MGIAPVTCSAECLTQVVTIVSVNEVHDAATTVCFEPAVNLFHQEVEQLTHVPSIVTNTTPSAKVVATVATITDVDPKAVVQELDTSPLPFINTSTWVVSDGEHGVLLVVSSNLAASAPTMRWVDCPIPAGDWVKPVTVAIDGADETHDTAIVERLHPPSFEHQPRPPPVQVLFNQIGRAHV